MKWKPASVLVNRKRKLRSGFYVLRGVDGDGFKKVLGTSAVEFAVEMLSVRQCKQMANENEVLASALLSNEKNIFRGTFAKVLTTNYYGNRITVRPGMVVALREEGACVRVSFVSFFKKIKKNKSSISMFEADKSASFRMKKCCKLSDVYGNSLKLLYDL